MNSFNDTKIKKIVNERFNDYFHRGAYFPMNEELNKGDIFTLNGLNPKSAAKMIAGKYGVSPDDFVPGKNGTIVYKPKRKSKVKEKVVSKPEGMSIEEYKEKYVIPMKPELDDIEGEEWRPVPNMGRYFGGDVDYGKYYEISNMGRLRTINLQNAAKSTISVGYDAPTRKAMQFHLNHKSGMNTCPDVKYMVADAFLGEHDLEDNMVIHIDGDYHNNRADNLKWVPRKKKSREMNINDIVTESIKRTLKENFSNRYTNAIKTIKHYLDIESETNHLSEEQLEQLSDVVNWLERHNGSAKWVKAGKQLLSKYSTAYSFGKNIDTFDTFPEDYEEDDIIYETVKRKLRESFETKYENAIDTVEYYLNMCSDGHQLSRQQCEQLSSIVNWLKETDANDNPSTPEWVEAAEEILNQCQHQQNGMLRESFSSRYQNAIDTIDYYLNLESETHHLSEEQLEQLNDVVHWLNRHCGGKQYHILQWADAGKELLDKYSSQYEFDFNPDTFDIDKEEDFDELDEKKNGGIRINPNNKGKFTATKKRTGKSTEELTHSKNPLTRKRAVFAQNAKKWNTNESLLRRILREELENASGERPSWQEILKRINDAGVNHAPKVQQEQGDGEEYRIGKYRFNSYTHTLTGPSGSVRIRPTFSNILKALCENIGEVVNLAEMFNITDFRNLRTPLSNMRKLFADDPNIEIIYNNGKAKLVVRQEGINEAEKKKH